MFGAGSRATVALTVLVREPGDAPEGGGSIWYHDIGDYLSSEQKLSAVGAAGEGDPLDGFPWLKVAPNEHADWIKQRSAEFFLLRPSYAEGDPDAVFVGRSLGLGSNRDAWNYNSSRDVVIAAGERMVEFFNDQVDAFERLHPSTPGPKRIRNSQAEQFVDRDPKNFSWTQNDYRRLANGERYSFSPREVVEALYRPYFKQFVNRDPRLNSRPAQLPASFDHPGVRNLAICVSGSGPFAALMTDCLPDVNLLSGGAYAFLRARFIEPVPEEGVLFQAAPSESLWELNVAESVVRRYAAILGVDVDPGEVFHYVYGVLHAADYRLRFAAELEKEMPRIPDPASVDMFRAYVSAGADLAALHTGYESVDPWPGLVYDGSSPTDGKPAPRITKLRYAKAGSEVDRLRIVCNSELTISGIPEGAHRYQVGTRSALDWVVSRYLVSTDADSGIRNDPNDWRPAPHPLCVRTTRIWRVQSGQRAMRSSLGCCRGGERARGSRM